MAIGDKNQLRQPVVLCCVEQSPTLKIIKGDLVYAIFTLYTIITSIKKNSTGEFSHFFSFPLNFDSLISKKGQKKMRQEKNGKNDTKRTEIH